MDLLSVYVARCLCAWDCIKSLVLTHSLLLRARPDHERRQRRVMGQSLPICGPAEGCRRSSGSRRQTITASLLGLYLVALCPCARALFGALSERAALVKQTMTHRHNSCILYECSFHLCKWPYTIMLLQRSTLLPDPILRLRLHQSGQHSPPV